MAKSKYDFFLKNVWLYLGHFRQKSQIQFQNYNFDERAILIAIQQDFIQHVFQVQACMLNLVTLCMLNQIQIAIKISSPFGSLSEILNNIRQILSNQDLSYQNQGFNRFKNAHSSISTRVTFKILDQVDQVFHLEFIKYILSNYVILGL